MPEVGQHAGSAVRAGTTKAGFGQAPVEMRGSTGPGRLVQQVGRRCAPRLPLLQPHLQGFRVGQGAAAVGGRLDPSAPGNPHRFRRPRQASPAPECCEALRVPRDRRLQPRDLAHEHRARLPRRVASASSTAIASAASVARSSQPAARAASARGSSSAARTRSASTRRPSCASSARATASVRCARTSAASASRICWSSSSNACVSARSSAAAAAEPRRSRKSVLIITAPAV